MPSQKNLDQIKDLKDKLTRAKSVVLADYRGLSVSLQQDLRQKILDAGGELLVIKNTLLKIALKEENFDFETLVDSFTGPTITLFAYEDSVAPIKALAEFAKEHELPQIKAGFLSKDPLTKDQVEELAKLPTKLELLAKTVATVKAPLTGFVNILSGNIRNLIYALEAIKQKGGGN
jgi:large subunit ribosomal protein L10